MVFLTTTKSAACVDALLGSDVGGLFLRAKPVSLTGIDTGIGTGRRGFSSTRIESSSGWQIRGGMASCLGTRVSARPSDKATPVPLSVSVPPPGCSQFFFNLHRPWPSFPALDRNGGGGRGF